MAIADDAAVTDGPETREVGAESKDAAGAADVGELWLRSPTGSYCAMDAVAGPIRREHGLLVCEVPRVGACVMLSRLDETLIDGEHETLITARSFVGSRVSPDARLLRASIGRAAVLELGVGARRLRRAIWLDHERDAVVVEWTLLEGDACALLVRPFVAMRPASRVRESMSAADIELAEHGSGALELRAAGLPPLAIAADGAIEVAADVWFRFLYEADDTREDLFTPGVARVALEPAVPVRLAARNATPWQTGELAAIARPRDDWRGPDGEHEDDETTLARGWAHLRQELFAHTCVRRERSVIVSRFPDPGEHVASTAMVVPALVSIGETERANELLASITEQLVPAVTTSVCSADAALWVVDAVRALRASGVERATLLDRYYPVCLLAIEAYASGVGEIHVADDGLLVVRPGVGTWLDVVIDGARDARAGRPVELQALWSSALHTTADLATDARALVLAAELRALAKRVRTAFVETFWEPSRGFVADRVRPDGSLDATLRPFQTMALAAVPPLLGRDESVRALDAVARGLVTTRGLRTAPVEDGAADARRSSAGDALTPGETLGGAAWPGFVGAFARAAMRTEMAEVADHARACCLALLRHASRHSLAPRYAEDAAIGGSPLAWNAAELMAGARATLDGHRWSSATAPGDP